MVDKILTNFQLWLLRSSDTIEYDNNLTLLLFIQLNNQRVMDQDYEVNVHDYITDDIA